MGFLDSDMVKGFMRMADLSISMGWHERNGGNLSYIASCDEIARYSSEFTPGEWVDMDFEVLGLKGAYLLVTGSGQYFMNVSRDPLHSFGLIELDETGSRYRKLYGLIDCSPTSELPAHLLNLETKRSIDPGFRIVYHAHTVNLNALTFVLPLTDEDFSRELMEMMPECVLVFPKGVGILPWMVPGEKEVARATAEKMKTYDLVIWTHHGSFAAGKSFDETFGLMHTAEKAAETLVKVISMGGKRQTTTPDQIEAVKKRYMGRNCAASAQFDCEW